MLLSRIGTETKSDTGKNNNYNSSNNSIATNNTTKTEKNESSNITNTTTKNQSTNTKNTNTEKTEDKTSKNENDNTTKNNKTENTQTGLSSYKAVWQYPNSTYPEQEFNVKSISDTKVNFDFTIDGITTFENASATINGKTAKFDIKNEGDWNIKGTITFEDNKVIFTIKESSSENIPTGSTTFKVKSNKSAF